ncbi:hypothetical protein [Pseudomonas fragariae (ex Marin et al. 2024)]|uniref:hypothetical protein n=1 Tax=Pseudomonas fragariae (ex Marin et al. 2024) TaxID=3080056 RepID=UPI003F7A41D2
MITAKVRVDAVRRILGSALQTVTGRFCWPTAAIRERLLSADSVEKIGISGWKKATLALVSEPGHHVAWLSSSALTVAAWLIG